MQAVDFERARISWTTKAGIHGTWRIVATACRHDSEDCIYLAPAVMAGDVFGAGRLPRDPPFSFQLVATRKRHAIIREGEAVEHRDSEAEHDAVFSSFDIQAPERAATLMNAASLDAGTVAQSWPMSARLKVPGRSGKFWNLQFPVNHINTRAAAYQVESGPVLIPQDAVDITSASVAANCYLAYVFFKGTREVDLLAWGAQEKSLRSFSRFARIVGVEAELLTLSP